MPLSSPSAAAFIAALTSSAVTLRPGMKVRSVAEPVGTGTRMAKPSSLPLRLGSTRETALAAPVVVGTRLIAAERARRRSLCGASSRFWSMVYAWMVVIRPLTMPKLSSRTFATGARQFVVQDAFDTCLLYTSDAADEEDSVDLGGRRIIKKKKDKQK